MLLRWRKQNQYKTLLEKLLGKQLLEKLNGIENNIKMDFGIGCYDSASELNWLHTVCSNTYAGDAESW
jgi:hypothetical protein